MIHIECSVIDLKTNRIKGKYYKVFDQLSEFNSWYTIAKNDMDTIMNIMSYNPADKPLQKQQNDVRLLSMSRSTEI